MPLDGPQQHHLPIQMRFNEFYPECSLLLGFHPSQVLGAVGGKLPITVYETFFDRTEAASNQVDKDSDAMDNSDTVTQDRPTSTAGRMIYKEIPYAIETGEAEMISVDFVARGGGNATAIESKDSSVTSQAPAGDKGKGKGKADVAAQLTGSEHLQLTNAEAEQIASLTAKANAVKMLHARLTVITKYLEQIGQRPDPKNSAILRSVQALLNRLALTVPANTIAFNQELLREANDVNLVNLLDVMSKNLKDASALGRKSGIIDAVQRTPFQQP